MELKMKKEGKFEYLETGGPGEVLLLLHGLFGGLSNFGAQIEAFRGRYNVVLPTLPMFSLPLRKVSLAGLVDHVADFVEYKQFTNLHLMGNSLGGHVGILYALDRPDRVASITLAGSSGLFESAMGNSFPPRGNYEFIKNKVETTFYDPATSTKALVDEVYDTVNDRNKGLRIVMTAKSAVRHNLAHKLHDIVAPTLLVWGKQDAITPPFVGEQFEELIPDAELHFIDECAHAPMMERPREFNRLLGNFLERVSSSSVARRA
ncbi:2-hydroxy-6-oxo-6-phenylhexa-2,4-dienoate hydrolase [Neolewinella maritima]|uniref:2-hydroxy-6-oxo-6-phenylhexa-2,4-dienoate hydrolase n=1 Tax=Neolewinella maritima TaxID=1383882 RepID=A0ABM9AXZ8_9BACT|nr:alpha/beta fold hydrolase [Neolewinella maritima]CAH0999173.1 2-hydroxy-6-oxo-6-phenylhexa-2,4-dienoate hydrolase [Neolewinella maritima]